MLHLDQQTAGIWWSMYSIFTPCMRHVLLKCLGWCSENDILEQLTPRLRAEVLHLAHNDSVSLLQGLPLFEDLEESSLSKIIVSLRSSFLPPDEIVFIAGEVGRQLYIIRKGVVAVRISCII